MQLATFPSFSRLIVKVGSSLLVTPEGEVRRDWLAELAADIAAATRGGQQVAIVSSGAIALGARRLSSPRADGRAWRMHRPPPQPARSR